jgi:hypothetical protein
MDDELKDKELSEEITDKGFLTHSGFFMNHNYNNLKTMLIMIDEVMRFYGYDEKKFRHHIANMMWDVLQQNLDVSTKDEEGPWFMHVGTFPKEPGEPGITHLLYEVMYYGKPHQKKNDSKDQ